MAKKATPDRIKFVEPKPTKTCARCEKTTVAIDKNYYMSSLLNFFPDGRINTCKECCWTLWEQEGLSAFLETLQMMDKPLLQDKFEGVEGDYKIYVKNISSIWGKDMSFKDSTMFAETAKIQAIREKTAKVEVDLEELTQDELKEAQEYWGYGYKEEEYVWLFVEFAKYGFDPERHSPTFEDLLSELCLTRLDMRNRRVEGKDVDKQLKAINDIMTAAGIKPTQENGTGNVELDAFAKLVEKIETERPISDPKPEWADVDGIRNMIVSFFLHPWARMWNKERESPYHEEAQKTLEKFTVKPRDYGN